MMSFKLKVFGVSKMLSKLKSELGGLSVTLDSWLLNLSKTGRSAKQIFSISVDVALVLFSLWCAYSLRLSTLFTDFKSTWHLFLVLPVLTVIVMASFGIYRWKIRTINRSLFIQLGKACFLSALILALLTYLFPSSSVNPRSIFIIYGLVIGTCTFSVRFVWQGLFDRREDGEPVAIYGAGATGTSLLRSLEQGTEYRPLMLLDDDPSLAGSMVCGVRVQTLSAGALSDSLAKQDIGKVILAMPSISPSEYQQKVDLIKDLGVEVRTIPTSAELVAGTAKQGEIRDISVDDLSLIHI